MPASGRDAAPRPTARRYRPLASTRPTLPRLPLSLATANCTVYLQRTPEPQDDRGYLGTTLRYQAPSGFMASGYLNHSYAYTFLREPFINCGEAMVGTQRQLGGRGPRVSGACTAQLQARQSRPPTFS